ncbi:MAG: hypothetical protein MMC33_008806 [Icmadophila ericetorum]|nr:hypothetical protein [Icmadophila ericetorum]
MKSSLLLFLAFLACFLDAAAILESIKSPDCMSICWDNSKYVSSCVNDSECFCNDYEFQNAVLQCLYSQCHTAQFGLALHFALSKCADYNTGTSALLPRLIHQQDQQKRDSQRTGSIYHSASHSAPTSTLHSVQRRSLGLSSSVSIFAQPTRRAAYDTANSEPQFSPQPTANLLLDGERA